MKEFSLKIESLQGDLSLNDIGVALPWGKSVWLTSEQAKKSGDLRTLVQKSLVKITTGSEQTKPEGSPKTFTPPILQVGLKLMSPQSIPAAPVAPVASVASVASVVMETPADLPVLSEESSEVDLFDDESLDKFVSEDNSSDKHNRKHRRK